MVGWVERVNTSGFEACVATSGPIRPRREVTVQWLAYDEVPSQGREGIMDIPLWTTGTECVTVDLSGQASTSSDGEGGGGRGKSLLKQTGLLVGNLNLTLKQTNLGVAL